MSFGILKKKMNEAKAKLEEPAVPKQAATSGVDSPVGFEEQTVENINYLSAELEKIKVVMNAQYTRITEKVVEVLEKNNELLDKLTDALEDE
jgi:hypothetical protein